MNDSFNNTFRFCPRCGSHHFVVNDFKSKRCLDCGFVYYLNPSSATAAFILNDKGQLLVSHRKLNPAKGRLDLPGGFCDMGESMEQGVAREVKEETGLIVTKADFLFSFPNDYLYSGFTIPTLDSFFLCKVDDFSTLQAADDAADTLWLDISSIDPSTFAFDSTRRAVAEFLKIYNKGNH